MIDERRRFLTRFGNAVVLPVLWLALAVTVAAACGLWSAAKQSDRLSELRQAREVRLAIGAVEDDLAQSQTGIAIWDPALSEVRRRHPDWKWIDNNVGSWLNSVFLHHSDFILDGRDRPLYAMIQGQRVAPDRFRSFAADIEPLVDSVRGRSGHRPNEHERLAGMSPASNSTVKTSPRAIHATDLVELAGRVAVVSVMRMIPDTSALQTTAGSEPLLISVRYLDSTFARDLSRVQMISDAHVATMPTVTSGQAAIPLISSRARHLGYLVWRPELPGSSMLAAIAPAAALAVGLLITALFLLAARLARMMSNDAATLEQLNLAHAELKKREAQALYRAHHDILTGLANRALFDQTVDNMLERSGINRCSAIMVLDLDRFKEVNDTLGHADGDLLLQLVAKRLLDTVGSSGMVSRLGGDEFAIVLARSGDERNTEQIAADIVIAIRIPFDLNGCTRFIGISIGVALVGENAARRSELMREADIAMYQAKRDRGGTYRFSETRRLLAG